MSKPLVKVCCISSLAEAKLALRAGADWLGLVSEMPSGPGIISLGEIAGIVTGLPPNTCTVLLTSERTCQGILVQHEAVKTWGIQLVDSLPEKELRSLRQMRPETYLIQVVHITGKSSISEALQYSQMVDALLLDSGNPAAPVKTLGGTGNTHDWNISHQICEASPIPVLLAGGLNPDNIDHAKSTVAPDGFDLCSGVRTDAKLDAKKLEAFMAIAHQHTGS